MRNWTRKTGLPVAAAFAVVLSGCDLEVLNPGAIQDADLNTPELMPILVNGVSAEYNDIGDTYAFSIGRLTDELAGTGSYTSTQEYRQGIFDWNESEGFWEQTHESAWSAGEAWVRLGEVLAGAENSSPDAAKLFALMGFAHLRLGENFCDVVYDVGAAQPRTAAFDSALVAFNQAITIGTAAGTAGDHWVNAARAGIAQANVGLGNWAAAATAAAAVPAGFADYAIYNAQANTSQVWNESWGRAEVGVYRTLAQQLYDTNMDPRTPYTKCGEWNDLASAYPANIPGGVTSTGDCTGQGSGAHQGADGDHAHYRQDKYNDRGSDIPRATKAEMHMIEAEAALQGTPDYAEFLAQVNLARAEMGMAARTETVADLTTMGMGSLDWPQAFPADDVLSILDEERYATLWITGRRLFDMDRWDHPFINGGWVVGSAANNPRMRCMPVPRNECQLNPNLAGSAVCS